MDNESDLINEQGYLTIKNIIRGKLDRISEGFISVGFRLKQIRDGKLYETDGYKDIYEFAEKEFSLTKTYTSRFMAINDRFSVGGNGLYLLDKYNGIGVSNLSEMLTLTDDELRYITDNTTRAEIRKIKKTKGNTRFNKTIAPAQQTRNEESNEVSTEVPDLIEKPLKVYKEEYKDNLITEKDEENIEVCEADIVVCVEYGIGRKIVVYQSEYLEISFDEVVGELEVTIMNNMNATVKDINIIEIDLEKRWVVNITDKEQNDFD